MITPVIFEPTSERRLKQVDVVILPSTSRLLLPLPISNDPLEYLLFLQMNDLELGTLGFEVVQLLLAGGLKPF